MIRTLYRYLLILFLLIPFAPFSSVAQNLTGIWRGYFISDFGDQYKLEFQISQNPTNAVSGVSYSYLDVRFYGKATMTGSFIKPSSSFRIREIKTVEVRSSLGGATCIMNYNFAYVRSGKEEFMEGTYLGKNETKYKTVPPAAWGDCGGGKVYLRKVTTSDFYVEPFLRNQLKNDKPIVNEPPVKKDLVKKTTSAPAVKVPGPAKKTLAKTTAPAPAKKDIINNKPIVKTIPPPVKPTIDPTEKTQPPVVKNEPLKQVTPTPEVLKSRENELVKTLIVNDPDVLVKLYDNGEIDGDTISVYMDKKLVLSSKGLTASPLTIKLKMDEDNAEHELVMVAENMGRIPPNTSLMIVESGDQRFEVRITSTDHQNAVVRFKYEKPK
jgi:hypothetical protein